MGRIFHKILFIFVFIFSANLFAARPSVVISEPSGNIEQSRIKKLKHETVSFIVQRTKLQMVLQSPKEVLAKGLFQIDIQANKSEGSYELTLYLSKHGESKQLNKVEEKNIKERRLYYRLQKMLEKLLTRYIKPKNKQSSKVVKPPYKGRSFKGKKSKKVSDNSLDEELEEVADNESNEPKPEQKSVKVRKRKKRPKQDISKIFLSPDIDLNRKDTIADIIDEVDTSQLKSDVRLVYMTQSQKLDTFVTVNSNATYLGPAIILDYRPKKDSKIHIQPEIYMLKDISGGQFNFGQVIDLKALMGREVFSKDFVVSAGPSIYSSRFAGFAQGFTELGVFSSKYFYLTARAKYSKDIYNWPTTVFVHYSKSFTGSSDIDTSASPSASRLGFGVETKYNKWLFSLAFENTSETLSSSIKKDMGAFSLGVGMSF